MATTVNGVDCGYEARQTSKEQTKMETFTLEGPLQCTIFCFALMNYVTNTFLLVSSSARSKQLLCFMHSQGLKREQKHTTKNLVEFRNIFPPLSMMAPRVVVLVPFSTVDLLLFLNVRFGTIQFDKVYAGTFTYLIFGFETTFLVFQYLGDIFKAC